MRLTQHSDYAMRLLMYVGSHPDRLCTISEVARAYGISEPHLMKVTHRLSQHGWLETVRGKNGGMRLAMPPQDIRLGAVVRDTEADLALVECLGPNNSCTLVGGCGLTGVVHGALQAFLQHLDQYTLADILRKAPTEDASPAQVVNWVK
ncbi:Rrf2 family transcriptional regulator [Pusillimonas sp.]|uniref:RrF2 family transcriptional regulator n=1 Tax=Pusillimonas sp. TaxID=3040095 RepID=UPI0029B2CA0F|nr:Rrf2 family transcriptional regulator [Pusillimonas sp.]MDX3893888.1 Rrf2 family transcriptional regulator [Pusillimonas sp.]